MRIIYLGTPEFAVPTLERLLAWSGGQIVGLVTQHDRPAGRGNNIYAPPTKVVAAAHGIPILQPEKLSRSAETVAAMRDLKPDILVMVAFGQILKQEVLSMAPMKVVNLHGSLLPKYRGAAPINWAIINGETVTGNTTMISDAGVDTGPWLLKQEVPLADDTTADELAHTLAFSGADLILRTLEGLANGSLPEIKQDDSLATFAPRLTKETGHIDWSKSAQCVHNLVRGLIPWPGTYTTAGGNVLKVLKARTVYGDDSAAEPGTISAVGDHLIVACGQQGQDRLELIDVQPPNKPRMAARDWANGQRVKTGFKLGV